MWHRIHTPRSGPLLSSRCGTASRATSQPELAVEVRKEEGEGEGRGGEGEGEGEGASNSNVDGVREHTTVSGNMSQRTGTSVSGNRNVGVREQYVGVREHMRTVHIVRCAACANSAQSA